MNSEVELSFEQALKNIEGAPEHTVIMRGIKEYRDRNIVSLGTDEAFALRDGDGEIRAFKQRVRLSQKDKTLIQPVMGGDLVISAQGYEVWAEAAGASVIFPKEVLVANKWTPNPCAERDPENRRILAVHARAVSFRFSSKGIPIVSDWTTIFDTPSYRLIDLLAKAKKLPQAFRLLPCNMKPETDEPWASYPFDESTNLWVNTAHDEALTWFSQILNREKKAMDFAQTFAKRNSLKHLSGLQKAPSNEWDVPVICWRPTSGNIIKWDASQYIQLREQVGSLIEGNGGDFSTKRIEAHAGVERTSDDENSEALEKETDPEDQAIDVEHKTESETIGPIETPEEAPEPVEDNSDAEEDPTDESEADNTLPTIGDKTKLAEKSQKIISNYEVAIATFPDEAAQAVKTLVIPTGSRLTVAMATDIMREVNTILDSRAENA